MIGYLIFGVLLILAGIYILFQRRTIGFLIETVENATATIEQATADYEALDTGMEEQRESFEQDFLSMSELLEKRRVQIEFYQVEKHELERANEDLQEIVRAHADGCLLDLEEMRQAALRAASLHE